MYLTELPIEIQYEILHTILHDINDMESFINLLNTSSVFSSILSRRDINYLSDLKVLHKIKFRTRKSYSRSSFGVFNYIWCDSNQDKLLTAIEESESRMYKINRKIIQKDIKKCIYNNKINDKTRIKSIRMKRY